MKNLLLVGLFFILTMGVYGKTETKKKSGPIDGVYKDYNPSGKLRAEIPYKNSKIDGVVKYWNYGGPSGEGELISYGTTTYKNGIQHGENLGYSENGKIRNKITYSNGKKDSLYQEWYDNGKLKTETIYKNDKIEGPYKTWYDNGELKTINHYVRGVEENVAKEYFLSGKLYKSTPMINGDISGEQEFFNEDGSLYLVEYWQNGNFKKNEFVAHEKEKMRKKDKSWSKPKTTEKEKKGDFVELDCSSDPFQPRAEEYNSKISHFDEMGENAAVGFKVDGGKGLLPSTQGSIYCTNVVNQSSLACPYAEVYLKSCLRHLGF